MAASSLSITRAMFHNSHNIPASSRVGHVSPSSSSPFPWSSCTKLSGLGFSTRPCSLPETKWSPPSGNDDDLEDKQQQSGTTEESALSEGILSACLVGLITGVAVVIFNNTVHDIRDFFWDGIPSLGASWLREEPIGVIWRRVILVPVCGGVLVGLLKLLQGATESSGEVIPRSDIRDGLQSFFNTLAACVTLGTGNSLGPEGPSVEIGSSIAKGYSSLFNLSSQRSLSLLASGSAAGIASGFNAAVAGCFFAVESVLWPSPTDSAVSLPNATSMVILSAVIASIVSEVGLGSEPAFKVPGYDFRSPTELPLYLLLGLLCGLVSLALTRCTSYMLVFVENFRKSSSTPKALLPVMGGLASGLIALKYPEILYWGFENVDILLESRPYVKGLSGDVLIQLVAAKILATSLCRASGLVGGYYAPSLFIGAATGMAYGKFISLAVSQSYPIIDFSILEVASPQAYGLVGMAATLAGVCQVPLTAVLLLFELTQDYRIVLPLLGAVGVSSWITSGQMKRGYPETKKSKLQKIDTTQQSQVISNRLHGPFASSVTAMLSSENDLCEVESTLCIDYALFKNEITKRIFVSQAMRTRYVTVCNCTSLAKAVDLMLAEKQPYAAIVNEDNLLVGSLTLEDIQTFIENATGGPRKPKELLVSEMYSLEGEKCRAFWTATPSMDLHSAELIMSKHGLGHLLVISDQFQHERYPVGILDRECISLACRAIATTERLSLLTNLEDHDR